MTRERSLPSWPDEPSAAQMMNDLWNALNDSERGHPASDNTPAECWKALLDQVRKIRSDRWALWHETGKAQGNV